ncbi:hypothetical protein ANN_07907, partial [Periplaneta americana]
STGSKLFCKGHYSSRAKRSQYEQTTEFIWGRMVGLREGGSSYRDMDDESRFNLDYNDGRIRIRRYRGQRYHPDCIVQRRTGRTPGVMVWCGIGYHSRSRLLRIGVDSTATAGRAVRLLPEHAKAFLEMADEVAASTMVTYFTSCMAQLRGRAVYVQFSNHKELKTDQTHSNANASPFLLQLSTQLDNWSWPHVSAATMQWYPDNNVHRLNWPARSPDLNPIKHLWDKLDRRLRSREMRPTSIVQLSAMLQEEWRRIPVDILQKLVESMPDRMAAVIATRGGTTRF